MKFRRDLECLEQFYLISFAKNERIFWILRRNLMKLLGIIFLSLENFIESHEKAENVVNEIYQKRTKESRKRKAKYGR